MIPFLLIPSQLSVVYDELSNLVDITTVSFNLSLGIPSGGNYFGNGVMEVLRFILLLLV